MVCCERGHPRTEMARSPVMKEYVCPACGDTITNETLERARLDQVSEGHRMLGTPIDFIYAMPSRIVPHHGILIEYPR